MDDVKGALNGPIGAAYKEAMSALDKENTQDGKQHLYKMKEMLNNVSELFHTSESGLDGIDQTLKNTMVRSLPSGKRCPGDRGCAGQRNWQDQLSKQPQRTEISLREVNQ
jgi:hypothetical protein